jgi:hypothetical protein
MTFRYEQPYGGFTIPQPTGACKTRRTVRASVSAAGVVTVGRLGNVRPDASPGGAYPRCRHVRPPKEPMPSRAGDTAARCECHNPVTHAFESPRAFRPMAPPQKGPPQAPATARVCIGVTNAPGRVTARCVESVLARFVKRIVTFAFRPSRPSTSADCTARRANLGPRFVPEASRGQQPLSSQSFGSKRA